MKLFPLKEFRFKTNPEIYMRIVGEYSEKRYVNIVHNFDLVAVDVIYFVLKSLVQFQSEVDMWFLMKQNVNRIFVNDRWLLWCTYLLACDFFRVQIIPKRVHILNKIFVQICGDILVVASIVMKKYHYWHRSIKCLVIFFMAAICSCSSIECQLDNSFSGLS